MNLLATYYGIQNGDKVIVDKREGIKTDEYLYFTILADNKEAIHMEQAALAHFLVENKYKHVAIPIRNNQGKWITNYQEKQNWVLQVESLQEKTRISHGKLLATFHNTGAKYGYEPNEISSYGKWKQLWIDKITMFENHIEQVAKEYSNQYYGLVRDILPYIIGISENAIQYVQESEQDSRFHEVDQSTITLKRYQDNCLRPVIWADDLMYDHPTRDLAEYIRSKILLGDKRSMDEISLFLKEYETVRPLSIFSWRLLYARLLFPIHIFDVIGHGFSTSDYDNHYKVLTQVIENQPKYEERMRYFFRQVGVDHEALQIPVLQWL